MTVRSEDIDRLVRSISVTLDYLVVEAHKSLNQSWPIVRSDAEIIAQALVKADAALQKARKKVHKIYYQQLDLPFRKRSE